MSYSYDRTKTAANILPWGQPVLVWMEDVANTAIKQLHAICGGNITRAKSSSRYGVFSTIDDAGFSGDLVGTVLVSLDWMKDSVTFRIWAIHPQRGNIDLAKMDLDFYENPDHTLERALRELKDL